MKIFIAIQEYFGFIGIDSKQLIKNSVFNPRNITVLTVFALSTIVTNVFLFCEADTFRELADSFYVTCTVTLTGANFANNVGKIPSLFKLVESIERLIAERIESPTRKKIYIECIQMIEKLSKFFIQFVMYLSIPCFMWPAFFISYYNYFMTDLQNEAFEMPYPMWFPINFQHPIMYVFGFCLQYLAGLCTAHVGICNVCFIGGICWILISMTKDIKEEFIAFDEYAKMTTNRAQLLKKFIEILRFHSEVRQIVQQFSELYRSSLRNLFLWGAATICGTLLLVQMKALEDERNFITFITLCGEMFWSFAFILMCEFGQRLTSAFDELNDVIFHIEWYMFPIEVQRMLPLVQMTLQKPVTIPVIGKVSCCRYVFDRIANRAFSCSMILRQFGR